MKHTHIKGIAWLLVLVMLFSVLLTACTDGPEQTTAGETDSVTERPTEKETVSEPAPETDESESTSESVSLTESETVTATETESEVETVTESETATETETVSETESETVSETETEDPRMSAEYAPVTYFDAKYIYNVAKPGEFGKFKNLDMVELAEDGSYTKLTTLQDPVSSEAYFNLVSAPVDAAPVLVMKYRTTSKGPSAEFFLDSVNAGATAGSSLNGSLNANGKWHLVTFDFGERIATFDGKTANYIRFDFFNSTSLADLANASIDVAYIAFFNSVRDAEMFEYGEDYVSPVYTVDPSSGYHASDLVHATCLDLINGGERLPGRGSNSKIGADVFDGYNTLEGNLVIISGWTVVEGGFSKILWSADGGKTWNPTSLYNRNGFNNGSADHLGVVDSRLGLTDAIKDDTNSVIGVGYQGTIGAGINCEGIAADLSAYEGQTVHLAFAAVPNNDPQGLVPIVFLSNLLVGEEEIETDTETESEAVVEVEIPVTDFSDSIEEANKLSNTVNAYFDDADRSSLTVTNDDVTYVFDLMANGNQLLTALTGKNGGTFLENTSDAFLLMKDGKKLYSSSTNALAQTNIYRQGYYFYDVHVYGADFSGSITDYKFQKAFPTSGFGFAGVESVSQNGGEHILKVTDKVDPRIYLSLKGISTEKFQFIELTMKCTVSDSGQIYVRTDDMSAFSAEKVVNFNLTPDGEYHTYIIPISSVPNYTGEVAQVRFDIGTEIGEEFTIKSVRLVGNEDVPSVGLDRTLYVYSDKANQVMHLVATADSKNIAAYGWETKVPAAKVAKLIVGDKNGKHESLDSIDWASATYIAFDLKNVGILGYILLDRADSGSLKVELQDGNYVITQSITPANNTITAGSDLYMGHRLYTKEIHSFDDFLHEVYCEYNPLKTVSVIGESRNYRFAEYDTLRGAYKFEVAPGSWNEIFLNAQNKHYYLPIQIEGDDRDRKIYVYSLGMGENGMLECAVMLDGNGVIVPINLEVAKNFAGDGEENIYLKDIGYSEVIFPLVIKKNSETAFNLVHLYQNWGKYPLKQIDSIQFYAPFYHLSTGVTETNCIRPWYDMNEKGSLYTLPDHRAWSAPLWLDSKPNDQQPQHTNGGTHTFLEYTDAEGKLYYSENLWNSIGSYGPTYAEMDMGYISDDGKIKVTYKHLEMPQDDENRTYYEVSYEILEDVKIANVLKDFTFYSVTGRMLHYQHLGYLNEQNECVITDATNEGEASYVLGDNCPYFSYFEFKENTTATDFSNDYVNVACLIYDHNIKINGAAYTDNLAVYEKNGQVHLTLNIDGEGTFKKGDKFSINMILIPWGSQEWDYSRADTDWNIREVRENTLLDPVKVTAQNGEVMDSVFMPRVKSADGKSVEFTVSGGENNLTVRAYGFKKAVRPVIYEKVNGQWVVYEVSSEKTPDSRGNAHDYDGYMIQYDGDGNYSYSFVFTMKDGAARTFKIVAE